MESVSVRIAQNVYKKAKIHTAKNGGKIVDFVNQAILFKIKSDNQKKKLNGKSKKEAVTENGSKARRH